MASIGSVACDFVRGRPPESYGPFSVMAEKIDIAASIETWIDDLLALGAAIEVWRRPGLAGYGIRGVDSTTPQAVTITVDDGTVFDACVIGTPEGRGVRVAFKRPVWNPATAQAEFWCRVEITGVRNVASS